MDDIYRTADDLYESNPEKALSLYAQAVDEYPEDVRGYVGLARSFCSLNKFDEAVENADKALAIDPSSAKAYHVLSFVSIMRKETEKGFLFAEKAYSIDPQSYPSLVNLGLVNDEAENYGNSVELYEKALLLRPENPGIRYKLIVNYLQLKRWDEAQLELRALRKTHSSFAIFTLRIAALLKMKFDTLSSIAKIIFVGGGTSIVLGAIFFQYLFLVIVSELLFLISTIITIRIGKEGKIGYIVLYILFMILILALAILDLPPFLVPLSMLVQIAGNG